MPDWEKIGSFAKNAASKSLELATDSMISTSKRYSKDKRFTEEGRQKYSDLADSLEKTKNKYWGNDDDGDY